MLPDAKVSTYPFVAASATAVGVETFVNRMLFALKEVVTDKVETVRLGIEADETTVNVETDMVETVRF